MHCEHGAPCPHRRAPPPTDFWTLAPLPHVAPERPSATSHSVCGVSRHGALRNGGRPPSAAASRTIIPSAATQYAPSGPARTNSKSRYPYGSTKFSLARFMIVLACPFAGLERQKPGALFLGRPGFRAGRGRFV